MARFQAPTIDFENACRTTHGSGPRLGTTRPSSTSLSRACVPSSKSHRTRVDCLVCLAPVLGRNMPNVSSDFCKHMLQNIARNVVLNVTDLKHQQIFAFSSRHRPLMQKCCGDEERNPQSNIENQSICLVSLEPRATTLVGLNIARTDIESLSRSNDT